MDFQLVLVILLFFLAVIYIGRMVYNNLYRRHDCGNNCGKCAADFSESKLPKKS
ncbi:MAG: FeoB-associated Cys-rich membrane protein [Bacteroidetes bacterium]|nr:FeoB-associated Cys-rich membrane protein [Bacteroidota bacterium]